jgi:hypothetical protein
LPTRKDQSLSFSRKSGDSAKGEEEDILAGDGADVMVGMEERKKSYCIPRTARYDSSGGKAVSQLFAALPMKFVG